MSTVVLITPRCNQQKCMSLFFYMSTVTIDSENPIRHALMRCIRESLYYNRLQTRTVAYHMHDNCRSLQSAKMEVQIRKCHESVLTAADNGWVSKASEVCSQRPTSAANNTPDYRTSKQAAEAHWNSLSKYCFKRTITRQFTSTLGAGFTRNWHAQQSMETIPAVGIVCRSTRCSHASIRQRMIRLKASHMYWQLQSLETELRLSCDGRRPGDRLFNTINHQALIDGFTVKSRSSQTGRSRWLLFSPKYCCSRAKLVTGMLKWRYFRNEACY